MREHGRLSRTQGNEYEANPHRITKTFPCVSALRSLALLAQDRSSGSIPARSRWRATSTPLTIANHVARCAQSGDLRIRALQIFNMFGALNPPAWAVLANSISIRASYNYLLGLHRFGLLKRTRNRYGLLFYSLSDRGRKRLQRRTRRMVGQSSLPYSKESTYAVRVPNAV